MHGPTFAHNASPIWPKSTFSFFSPPQLLTTQEEPNPQQTRFSNPSLNQTFQLFLLNNESHNLSLASTIPFSQYLSLAQNNINSISYHHLTHYGHFTSPPLASRISYPDMMTHHVIVIPHAAGRFEGPPGPHAQLINLRRNFMVQCDLHLILSNCRPNLVL